MTPAARREAVAHLAEAFEMSEQRACRVVGVDRTSMRYEGTSGDDIVLRGRLHELAVERRRFGYRRLHILLKREGHAVNRKRVQRLYREEKLTVRWRGGRKPSTGDAAAPATELPSPEASSTPEERIEAAYQELHSTLRRELLERISQNSPAFFEQLIVDLLVAMGYGGTHKNAAQQLGRSGDGGVDGVINEDRLGLDRVYVQAKRYAAGNSVGRPDIQGFVGSLVGLGATKGVFVTTSTFSSGARDFVRHLSQRVILIDGQTFADLMIEHGVGVRTSQTLTLSRLDEDFFAEEG